MALSIAFAMPGPKFDPAKYGRKSLALSPSIVGTTSTPEIEAMHPIASKRKSTEPETDHRISTLTRTDATIETIVSAGDSTCPHKTLQTTSSSKQLTTEDNQEPVTIPEAQFERNDLIQALQPAYTKLGDNVAKQATIFEVSVMQEDSNPGFEAKLTEPFSKDVQLCHTTVVTAKDLNIPSVPALVDVESTDTQRLVSIRRIRNIRQAKFGSRWLTLAQVDEWTCTVPRHAFREGELVVYVEIDAFLPSDDHRFGMMSLLQTYNGHLGHRVKTRRFGSYPNKLVVQGYIYPLEKFEEIFQELKCIRQVLDYDSKDKSSQEMIKGIICAMYRREDWAAKIGVKKWEEPKPANVPNKHPKLGAVPTRVFKKTDVTHFEDCPNLFIKQKYFAREYQESIKMDGASMTAYFVKKTSGSYHDLNELPEEVGPNMVLDNGRFGVTSKSVDLNELSTCAFGYWKTALKNDLPAKLSKLDRSIAVQGEICGPGINQNREKLDETEFFVYSMWDIAAQKYIDPQKVQGLAGKLGLKHVPVLGYVRIRDIASSHSDLRNLADKRPGEGLVYKCVRDGRSFKVHSAAYKVLHNC